MSTENIYLILILKCCHISGHFFLDQTFGLFSRIETKRNESNQNRTFLGAIGARTSPWRTETRWPLTEWQRSPENRFRFGIWIGELLFKRSGVSYRIASYRID